MSDTSICGGRVALRLEQGGIPGEHKAPCSPWIFYRLPAMGLGDHQVVWPIGPLLEISKLKEAEYEKKARMRAGMRSVAMRVRTHSVVMDKIFCQTRRIWGQSFASCLHNSQYKWAPTLPWNQVTILTCCRAREKLQGTETFTWTLHRANVDTWLWDWNWLMPGCLRA